jgi:hypothetical protein
MSTINHLKNVVKQQLNEFKSIGRQISESVNDLNNRQILRKRMHDKCIVLNTARMQLCTLQIRLCRNYLDAGGDFKLYTDDKFVDWSLVKFNMNIQDLNQLIELHQDKDPGFVIADYLIQDLRMLSLLITSINEHARHINQCKTVCMMLKDMIH